MRYHSRREVRALSASQTARDRATLSEPGALAGRTAAEAGGARGGIAFIVCGADSRSRRARPGRQRRFANFSGKMAGKIYWRFKYPAIAFGQLLPGLAGRLAGRGQPIGTVDDFGRRPNRMVEVE